MSKPLIGIAPDIAEPKPGSLRAVCPLTYSRAVLAAGGEPIILAPLPELIPDQLARCAAFILTGGDDPRTEHFGEPTHPKATPVHPARQAYDEALLRALMQRRETPTLGICLGMQMMALIAGGSLHQHLPETLASHDQHYNDRTHPIQPTGGVESLSGEAGTVTSHHRQAVRAPGSMRIAAVSPDGVIEAIDLPGAKFFLGVQWHPERTTDDHLGLGLIRCLVEAAR